MGLIKGKRAKYTIQVNGPRRQETDNKRKWPRKGKREKKQSKIYETRHKRQGK